MTNTKKILITTKSFERYSIRVGSGKYASGHCPLCREDVELITIDEAVSISGIRTGELIRRAEANDLHAIETDSGHLLICARSVRDMVRKRLEKDNENK